MDTTAPECLGTAGAALWHSITSMTLDGASIDLRPDELAVLGEACKTADTIAMLEQSLHGAPVIIAGSRGQDTVHPAVVELRHQRAALSTLLRRLDLPDTEDSWDNLTASQRARKAARARWSA